MSSGIADLTDFIDWPPNRTKCLKSLQSVVEKNHSMTTTAPVNVVSLSPYEQLVHNSHNDARWSHEVSHGKRVGLYRFSGEIGSGNFSQVKMAVHQLTKDKVAIKIIDKSKLDAKTRKMLTREIATMEHIHHSNIIRLLEVVETYSKIHLVLEYARGGELFNKISTEGKMSENDARPLFLQVASAVQHLHSKGFVHRDIKAENVFFSTPHHVKLGDFGFSTRITGAKDEFLNTFCGSPPYAAPELFRDQQYSGEAVDSWALGILLHFMVTGNMPFRAATVAALKTAILDGKYTLPSHVSGNCAQIIDGALQQSPQARLTPPDMLGAKWLCNVEAPQWSGPQEAHMLQPTITLDLLPLNPLEIRARKKLETYGIGAKLLCDSSILSYKSAVIGIYRIVMNRYLQEAMGEGLSQGSAEERRGRKKPDKKVSRTCTVL